MLILTTIFSFLGGLLTPVTEWLKRKQEVQAAKDRFEQELKLQAMKNMGRMEEAEAKSSGERLRATSAIFKYGTFFMWFYPFFIAQFMPQKAEAIFNNLSLMPAWYTQSCVIIMFAIWGISVSAPVVTSMFSNLSAFLSERREHKERLAEINREAMFDYLRSKTKGKALSQDYVDVINDAIDAGMSQEVRGYAADIAPKVRNKKKGK